MSAWLCSPYHLGQLARYAKQVGVVTTDDELTALADSLLAANLANLRYLYEGRYDHDSPAHLRFQVRNWTALPCAWTPVEAMKAAACTRYQCCDRPQWAGSSAEAMLERIQVAARALLPAEVEAAYRAYLESPGWVEHNPLPGWDAAPWGFEAPVSGAVA